MTTPESLIVKHNPQAGRFELEKDGHLAVLEYELAAGKIIYTHTGVPAALEGQGIGSSLAHAGLEYARAQGLKAVPLCSFVAAYIRRNSEYQELV
ncbi:MAG: GNAT family N-acetyltransferase [Chloroflexota bacterium]